MKKFNLQPFLSVVASLKANLSGFSFIYLFIILVIAGFFFATSMGVHLNPDGILYFSYLRSAFFDHDILMVNEFNELDLLALSRHVSETGLEGNHVAIGTSILMAPFYAVALFIDWLFSLSGITIGDDGYRGIYAHVFPFGSLFYGGLIGLMTLSILKKTYWKSHAELSLLHIALGTPFMYYLAVHYQLSHLCSAFSVTLFLYYFERIRNDNTLPESISPYFFLGALSGISILVRTQNGLFWVIPFAYLLFRLWHIGNIKRIFLQGGAFLTGAAIWVSPQLTVWKILHGNWIHAPEAANLNFLAPHYIETLISPYHGLFFWSPILILSVIGLFLLVYEDAERGIPLLSAVLLQLLINGSMRVWWEGASFGLRLFLNCTPIFCIGLSVLYSHIQARWMRVLGSLFVFWTFLLYLVVLTGGIDLNWYYSASELLRLQWQQFLNLLKPGSWEIYSNLLQYGADAVFLIFSVVLTIMILTPLSQTVAKIRCESRYPLLLSLGVLFSGIGLSAFIGFMGMNSHAHRVNWKNDLQQIESGLNSYSKFYIDYSFYIIHAEYLIDKGQQSKAIEEYQKAIQIYPTPKLYQRLVSLLIENGRLKKAKTYINKALTLWPENSDLLRQSAQLKVLTK